MKVFVAVRGFRDGEADCLGVWKSKEKAISELKETLDFNPEFSDALDDEPYFGTEEWLVILKECDFDDSQHA